ncbi:xanthine/uracil permease [Tumebacillus sp. BK434]|uniref:purine/pyrimidine permease n=1 Tax=Tumebacillus sp. BK434 TaxID=2512169 RepID=UPI0010492FA2|nr:purine/pyrimidine permease [Tumebacillus sp. BK434]TCP52590.1 xanthine/uracil permease [Tumebacillus sp. BK434]
MKLKQYLSTVQWFMFLVANSIAIPVVVGTLFHLPVDDIASLIQRTCLVVGLSSFLQGWLGHRLPIADGPAGSWVSVFVVLADLASRQGQSVQETLQLLSGAVLLAGVLLAVLGLCKAIHRLAFLFTPLVTGTFLLMLALQLCGVFMKGMFGLTGGAAEPDYAVTALAMGIFLLVLVLSLLAKGWVKQYAVLIGLLAGWLLYEVLGMRPGGIASATGGAWLQPPDVFAWGLPLVNVSIVITVVLFTFLLISNTVAAISAVEDATGASPDGRSQRLNRAGIMGGVSHMLASVFSTIGVVPLPVSAGFIRMTEQRSVRPFLAAGLLFTAVSFLPAAVHGLALLPGPIASAALLTTFVQMIGIAMRSITSVPLDERRMSILGISLACGMGLMALPGVAIQGLPVPLQYILGNGLLFGTMTVIVLERVWKPRSIRL